MAAPADIALRYDPLLHRCDLVLNGRDLALDATPATPMLISLGADRRARPDDVLPDEAGSAEAPVSLVARRGTPLDALDAAGRRMGSRLWLLSRAKQTEVTRRQAEIYATEALAWLTTQRGLAVAVTAAWVRRGVLGLTCRAGDAQFVVQRSLG
jgi:phage gp46-like protein